MAGSPIKHERNRIVRQAILDSLKTGEDPSKALEPFVAKMAELALSGDMQAMREMFDRIDGKAAQQLQLQGDEDAPLVHKIVREVTKP